MHASAWTSWQPSFSFRGGAKFESQRFSCCQLTLLYGQIVVREAEFTLAQMQELDHEKRWLAVFVFHVVDTVIDISVYKVHHLLWVHHHYPHLHK